MKTAPGGDLRVPAFHRYSPGKRSSALLIVLGCLVLISVLIVAFFYAVTAERQSAQMYANTSSVKMLADSTVSIVQGQIKNATKGTDSSGNTLAWASQPGMIRTYNTSGQPVSFYKLYSWNGMVTNSFNPTSASELPPTTYAGWAGSPSIYTDLNEPVSGVYPIVDPAAKTTLGVQGFDFNTSGMTNATSNALPMPAKWLYVLQSGQVIAPDTTSTGNTASFTQAAIQPSSSNPIVARMAFWTDDDTCKVNINTAAGDVWVNTSSLPNPGVDTGNPGSFWDTPRVYSGFETNLALYQPAQGEYQRYPGHPATTYLSAVFPNILKTAASIYSIAPRVSLGGSLSGTTYPTASMLPTDDSDRLYSSVDELLVSATNMTTTTPPTRVTNTPLLTKTNLEQGKFFLTAASRAPEVNLYNEPRVVIWPISTGTVTGVNRTAYDNLIAYCGTLNSNLYYFQRGVTGTGTGANSPTSDLPAPSSMTVPATDLTRNKQLINYLRNLTSLPVPGFSTGGETFYSKYSAPLGSNNGKDRDQLLTEIFDYIRSLNTQDSAVTKPYTPSTYGAGEGQIVPIVDTGSDGVTPLRGFGHMPVITEVSLLFVDRAETGTITTTYTTGTMTTSTTNTYTSNNTSLDPTYNVNTPGTPVGAVQVGNSRVQAALLIKFFDPCQGYAYTIPNFKVNVTGLSGMNWNVGSTSSGGTSVFGTAGTGTVTISYATGLAWGAGELGINPWVFGSGFLTSYIGTGTLDVPTIQTSGATTTPGLFSISDTKFNIMIYSSAGTLLQTYSNLEFPASRGGFPVPQLPPIVTDTSAVSSAVGTADYRDLRARFNSSNSAMLQTFICSKDVVRSIALMGDPRIVAASTTVPGTWFAPVYGYDPISIPPTSPTQYDYQAHGIIGPANGNHRPYYGAQLGAFVNGAKYETITTGTATTTYPPDFGPYVVTYPFPTGTATPTGTVTVTGWVPGATQNGPFISTTGTTTTTGTLTTGLGTTNPWSPSNSSWTPGVTPTVTVATAALPWSGQYKAIAALDPNIFIAGSSGQGGYAVPATGVTSGTSTAPGDWDNGSGAEKDGAYINKADEGAIEYNTGASFGVGLQTPYYGAGYRTSVTGTASINIAVGANFSPNRQMPSAGMFGSLPTGVNSQQPWQTLLFRPSPDGNILPSENPSHIGAQSPQDHLLLDLFNMPIVEPYAISDPFSTAGKVNMNYQIVPFTYITRSTAVQAVMRSEQDLVVPLTAAGSYKGAATTNLRHYLDLSDTSGTLVGFKNMFTKGTPDGTGSTPDIFRSASQICNVWLVPVGQTYTGMQAYWQNTAATGGVLTGDNSRERPYANIYPRLTTKSNTYTVHMRVQTLKKIKSTDPTTWVEGSDVISGEYRGSTTMERYLDTSGTGTGTGTATIPDYATLPQPLTAGQAIDNYYKFRVIETKQFTP